MNLRLLINLTAIVAIAFGVGYVLVPAALWSPLGVHLDASGVLVARLFGAANVGIGLVVWFTRTAGPAAERGIGYGIAGWAALEGLVIVLSVLSGAMNALGWGLVLFDVVLVLAYGFYLVGRAPTVATAT